MIIPRFVSVCFVLMILELVSNVRAISIPRIKWGEFSQREIHDELSRLSRRNVNYEAAVGLERMSDILDATWITPRGFQLKRKKVLVGRGSQAFIKASQLLKCLTPVRSLRWARIATEREELSAGHNFATVTRFYNFPVWSINPCRCTSTMQSTHYRLQQSNPRAVGRTGLYSELVFATLDGHTLAGSEALRVYSEVAKTKATGERLSSSKHRVAPGVGEEDLVVFEVVSFSRGSGALGRLVVPLLRPLQDRFVNDCCSAMVSLMK